MPSALCFEFSHVVIKGDDWDETGKQMPGRINSFWGYYLGVWFVAVIYLGSGASFLKIFTNIHEIVRDFFP